MKKMFLSDGGPSVGSHGTRRESRLFGTGADIAASGDHFLGPGQLQGSARLKQRANERRLWDGVEKQGMTWGDEKTIE